MSIVDQGFYCWTRIYKIVGEGKNKHVKLQFAGHWKTIK